MCCSMCVLRAASCVTVVALLLLLLLLALLLVVVAVDRVAHRTHVHVHADRPRRTLAWWPQAFANARNQTLYLRVGLYKPPQSIEEA